MEDADDKGMFYSSSSDERTILFNSIFFIFSNERNKRKPEIHDILFLSIVKTTKVVKMQFRKHRHYKTHLTHPPPRAHSRLSRCVSKGESLWCKSGLSSGFRNKQESCNSIKKSFISDIRKQMCLKHTSFREINDKMSMCADLR